MNYAHPLSRTIFGLPSSRQPRLRLLSAQWQRGPGGACRRVSTKNKKMEILKVQIHVTQNIGKVWIGRTQNFPAPFGAIPGNFFL